MGEERRRVWRGRCGEWGAERSVFFLFFSFLFLFTCTYCNVQPPESKGAKKGFSFFKKKFKKRGRVGMRVGMRNR